MRGVVQNLLLGLPHLAVLAEDAAGVGVAVEAREVAARHLQPNPVPGLEPVGRRAEVDGDLGRRPRRQQARRGRAGTVARAQDPVGQRPRGAAMYDVLPVTHRSVRISP